MLTIHKITRQQQAGQRTFPIREALGKKALLSLSTLLASCQLLPEPSDFWRTTIGGDWHRPSLTLLPLTGFQQTTDYTCGPAAVKTLLRYYDQDAEEMTLAKEMDTTEALGTHPAKMADWLNHHGFKVTWGEGGSLAMLRTNLSQAIPTLVEWNDWGGHWVVVVGYDDRGTDKIDDDVIIFADPSDTYDDNPDGITWFSAERFNAMWFEARWLNPPMERLYLTATPESP